MRYLRHLQIPSTKSPCFAKNQSVFHSANDKCTFILPSIALDVAYSEAFISLSIASDIAYIESLTVFCRANNQYMCPLDKAAVSDKW